MRIPALTGEAKITRRSSARPAGIFIAGTPSISIRQEKLDDPRAPCSLPVCLPFTQLDSRQDPCRSFLGFTVSSTCRSQGFSGNMGVVTVVHPSHGLALGHPKPPTKGDLPCSFDDTLSAFWLHSLQPR